MAKIKVRARAVDMLGRQQIAGIPTAIHELFKNAHDAYANVVEVDYFRDDELLVLRDDGFGMTKGDFESKWLTLGTESKVGANSYCDEEPLNHDSPRRPIMGEKGIGRLAIAAIGPQVIVISRAVRHKKLSPPVVSLINWSLFEIPGLDLSEIEIPIFELKSGAYLDLTTLQLLIRSVRDNVNGLNISETYRKRINSELDTLSFDPAQVCRSIGHPSLVDAGTGTHFFVCPTNSILGDDIDSGTDDAASPLEKMLLGFSNTMMPNRPAPVIVSEFRDHHDGRIDELIAGNAFFTPEEFIDADHHIEGHFDDFGQFQGSISVYRESAKAHSIQWPKGNGRPTDCGPFKIKFAYVQGRPTDSRLPPADWAHISAKLNRIGGLYVYRDGIRVLPYGNSDFDFLNIERRRTKSAQDWFFSYRRLLGAIEITHANNADLVEKAGREGFRTNRGYREFVNILENFFQRLAFDFFRPTSIHGEIFNQQKEVINKQAELIAKRAKFTRHRLATLGAELDKFFLNVEKGLPSAEASRIISKLQQEIHQAVGNRDVDRAAQLLLEAEQVAEASIHELVSTFKIKRPRGVGLNKTREKDWASYEANLQKLVIEIFDPLQEQARQLVGSGSKNIEGALDRRKRIAASLELRRHSATGETSKLRREVQGQVSALSSEVEGALKSSLSRLNADIEKIFIEFGQTDTSNVGDDEINRLQSDWESKVEQTTFETRDLLEGLRDQLFNVVNAVKNQETLDETTAALETEAESLREQLEMQVELAQVGMALGIVQHEFSHTVRTIRNALRKLGPWAAGTPGLRSVEKDLRVNFDHLDSYLTLFTPMSRRLNRATIELSGDEIRKYVDEVFSDRLKRHSIKLETTSAFEQKTVKGFSSTFLPAFVNLIDNAIYWINQSSTIQKLISLDADDKGFLVSNTGPGINARIKERIFDFGESNKPGGRGMGLYLSKQALKKEGFDLLLESNEFPPGPVFRILIRNENREGISDEI